MLAWWNCYNNYCFQWMLRGQNSCQWELTLTMMILLIACYCGVAVAQYTAKRSYKRSVQSKSQEGPMKLLSTSTMERHLRNDKIDFIQRVGYDIYGYNGTPGGFIDDWRSKEFPTLIPPIPIHDDIIDTVTDTHRTNSNRTNHDSIEREIYVDYAGAALPTHSQMNDIRHIPMPQILGNPHSMGPAAARTKAYMAQVTQRVLDHFHAHPGTFHGHTSPTNENRTNSTTAACHNVNDHPGYDVVFTSGTTDAIRIVAELFPWGSQQSNTKESHTVSSPFLVYAQNSHTSVIGIREVALQRNSSTRIVCQPMDELLDTILRYPNCQDMEEKLDKLSMKTTPPCNSSSDEDANTRDGVPCRYCLKHLLVVPMECNFSGDRPNIQAAFRKLYDMDLSLNDKELVLCRDCQQNDFHQTWYTMLDIAKAASTGPVNLCELNPDFAAVSFYKMFGEPTGLGCLFVKRTAIDVLFPTKNKSEKSTVTSMAHRNNRRQYVGGGSVNVIVPGTDYTVLRTDPTPLSSLQRGTPHFRGMVALLAGFHELHRVGGMERIRLHTQCLKQEFVRRLQSLRHGNDRNVIVIYGHHQRDSFSTSLEMGQPSGPIVTFNVLRADGSYVGYNEVSKLAALYHHPIQLRAGCFCNPGACQIALELSDEDVIRNYEESGHVCGDPIDIINNRPTGAVRVSFGKDSIWEDMNAVVTFLQHMFVNNALTSNNCKIDNSLHKSAPTKVVITELYIFPIKSCAAQRVNEWPMAPSTGRLRFDREFALVDASGTAMRLQMFPAMAQLRPTIDLKAFTLTIRAPDLSFSPLTLDLDDQLRHAHDRKQSTVKVCGNRCSGVLWGDHSVSQWFSRYLGVQCWLARHTGNVDGLYEPPKSATSVLPDDLYSSSLSFANEQPLLLISEHAVKILNDAMRVSTRTNHPERNDSVCSRQFRPNIVIRFGRDYVTDDQEQRHIEDAWSRITLVDDDHQKIMSLAVVGACARCAMVDIDPTDGHKVGTLRALATYRRSGNAQITFGIFVRANPNVESLLQKKNVSRWLHLREGNILLCE